MLLPIAGFATILRLKPGGVLHVGAHRAEEYDDYERFGWAPRIWVEALPDLAADLRSRFVGSPRDEVVEGAAWHTGGMKLLLNRTSADASSSVFPLGEHADVRPDITVVDELEVESVSLKDVTDAHLARHGRNPEFLNIDIQGAELAALRSFGDDIPCKWVVAELSWRSLYRGQPLLSDIDGHLHRLGFLRVALAPVREAGWGDAVYARREAWLAVPLARRLVFRGWT